MDAAKKFFLILLGACIAMVIIAEVFARIFYPLEQIVEVTFKGDKIGDNDNFKLSSDPVLLYEWSKLPQRVTAEKNQNTYRIIVLGDSIVYRKVGVLGDYFPKLLEDLLNAKYGKSAYQVINAGVPGYDTKQEVRYLESRFLNFSPDMIIVGYSPTDRVMKRCIKKYKDGLYSSDIRESYPYLLGLPDEVSFFFMKHSALYRIINAKVIKLLNKIDQNFLKGKIRFYELSWETEEAIKRLKDLALKEKFDLLFVVFPLLHNGEQHESDWVVAKCRQYGIKYIDLRSSFEKIGYEKLKFKKNDISHLNWEGHRVVTEEIFRYLSDTSTPH